MAPVLNAAAAMALAGSASAFVVPSAFNGAAVTSKSAASSTKLSMSVDTGINGFGRIGRLVARSMVKNPETNLKLINTGAAPEYMAYQVRAPSGTTSMHFAAPWIFVFCLFGSTMSRAFCVLWINQSQHLVPVCGHNRSRCVPEQQ